LSLEDEKQVKQIVLSDSRIQKLIKGREYVFNVNEHVIKGKEWGLDVGAVLKEDVTFPEIIEWLEQGRKDKTLIAEIVGELSVGHNDAYDLSIDVENARVQEIEYYPRHGTPIPELTHEEKESVVIIALDDHRLQELLQGKNYTVAPEGVVVWHNSKAQMKIGGGLEIWFDRPYEIEYDWPWPEFDEEKYPVPPNYGEQTYHRTYKVKALSILVDLEKQRVVGIINRPISKGTKDLYKP